MWFTLFLTIVQWIQNVMHLNVIEIKNIIPNDVIHYASFLVETNENPTSSHWTHDVMITSL